MLPFSFRARTKMPYTIHALRNFDSPKYEIEDNASFDSLKALLEAIAQDIRMYSATSFVYTIVPPKEAKGGD